METIAEVDTELVVARPSPANWFAAVFFALIGALAVGVVLTAPNNSTGVRLLAGAILAAPLFLLAGGCALWTLQARIVADAVGLRWRSVGQWRSARWDEVTDYYDRRLPKKSTRRMVVETRAGKIAQFNDLSNRELLREVIARRATAARAQGWGLLGARPEDDWPRVFGYDTKDNRTTPWVLGTCTAGMLALYVGLFVPKFFRMAAEIGWPLTLTAGLLMFVVMLGMPLVVLLAAQPAMREARRRRGETVTVDREGIRWQNGREAVQARWDEVTDYYFGPSKGSVQGIGPAVVVTRRGTFDFLYTIEETALLREVIQRYATSARAKEWRSPETDRLGDEASRWSSGCVGVGPKRYHYRTRTNRAVLAIPCAYWLAWSVSAWIGPLRTQATNEPVFFYTMGVLLTLGVVWPIWRYATAAVLVDERGIEQRAWNGASSLKWAEVEEYFISGSEGLRFGNVVGNGKRVRFWLGIADGTELMDEICARAVNARAGEWNKSGVE